MNRTIIHNACQEISERFKDAIKFLLVDDDQSILEIIPTLFTSPLINISTASTTKSAIEIISQSQQWHCWILDITLGQDESGLSFLTQYPNFPFIVMLSGMGSMSVASDAMKLGALKVFDKKPDAFESFFIEICKIAALSYILSGKSSKNFNLFNVLSESYISSPEQWADKGCITTRQLERICSVHSSLTPRYILSLYNTIEYLLKVDFIDHDNRYEPDKLLCRDILFVLKNIDKFI